MKHQQTLLRSGNRTAAWLLAAASCFAVACSPLSAQQGNVSVQCVDENGQPVVGAEVWLFQGNGERYEQSGPFVSNMGGQAECGEQIFTKEKANYDRWAYARIEGKLVGFGRATKWTNRTPINVDFEVRLQPSRSIKGKVTVPEGVDPATVTVKVQTLHAKTGPEMFDYNSLPRSHRFSGLDSGLKEFFECVPNKEGVIEFRNLPVEGRVYLLTRSEGMGQAQWRSDEWTMEPDIELVVKPEIPLNGKVVLPDGMPAAGLTVKARLESGEPFNPSHLSTFTATTNGKGEYALTGLPNAKFTIAIESADESLVFMPMTGVLLPSATENKFDLKLQESVAVSGAVNDSEGRAAEGAAISAVSAELNTGFDDTTTDKDGKFGHFSVNSTKILLLFMSDCLLVA